MKKTTYLLIVALLIANIFTGCSPQPESISGRVAYQMDVDNTVLLDLTVLPEDVQDKSLAYSTSAADIADVDETGTVKAISPGTATITATTSNGISLEVGITVTQPVQSVTAEETLTLDIGLTGCVNAQIQPLEATDPSLTYLSDDEQVATVDETGLVTAITAGETAITITAHNGQEAKTIIIVETPVSEVLLDQAEMILDIGVTHQLSATVLPEDATHPGTTWESSNADVATVDENGNILGITQGEATITVCTENGMTATCTVTVKKNATSSNGTGSTGSTGGGNGTGDSGTGDSGTGSTGGDTGSTGSDQGGNGGGNGGVQTQQPLTDDQINAAIGEVKGHAQGLGFTIVGSRQPGHSIASVAYYDYGAFVRNLKDNVDYVASLFAGEDLSLVNLCFVREGNSVYVTYG